MVSLKCECCGFEADFADPDEAFMAGWDAPPHFTQVVCCDLCPASLLVMGQAHRHEAAHQRWAVEGRPAEFELRDLPNPALETETETGA